MRMLTGLSRPTGGKACVAGFDVASQPEEVKKNIGYMTRNFPFTKTSRCGRISASLPVSTGIPEAEIAPKTDELLLRLGLEKERDTLVKSLPLGWKQKLAFSVSIFHRPKIVFLDEPTGGVDPATRRQFWELIYQAADEGITVFVTTHFMDEAEYCDRHLHHGRRRHPCTRHSRGAETAVQCHYDGRCIPTTGSSSCANRRLKIREIRIIRA